MGKKSTSASFCSRDAVGFFFSLLPRNRCINSHLLGTLSCEKCKDSGKKAEAFLLESFT